MAPGRDDGRDPRSDRALTGPGPGRLQRLRTWARAVRRDALALWLAMGDPRVPWPAKLLAALVAGYAFSPIDLIPDFIPVLGLLDDAILLPLGILAVVRLIPPEVMADLRRQAEAQLAAQRPRSLGGALFVLAVWVALAGLAARLLLPRF